MKSLREEIQNIIYKKIGGKEHVGIRWTECQEATNEIVSIFAKRIETIIEGVKDNRGLGNDLKLHNRGYVLALKQVKEILK